MDDLAQKPRAATPEAVSSAGTVACPKCGHLAREVARFCPRCHQTLRFTCPACFTEQRHGGSCARCGVDFAKYVAAVVAAKQAEADVIHERLERRSQLMKNMLLAPFTGGFSLLRSLFRPRDPNR